MRGSKSYLNFELSINYYKVIFGLRHSQVPEPARALKDLSGKPKIAFLDPPSPEL